jgi:hypothetical protein
MKAINEAARRSVKLWIILVIISPRSPSSIPHLPAARHKISLPTSPSRTRPKNLPNTPALRIPAVSQTRNTTRLRSPQRQHSAPPKHVSSRGSVIIA